MANGPYKRILLKLSGEAFLGDREHGIDPKFTQQIAKEIADVFKSGIQIAIVIGSGNIFRGAQASENGIDRATADYIGMLATVMNALALQDALEKAGLDTRVQTAIAMPDIAEPYIRRRAIHHMEKGRVVIFGAGTGNPFFTTDMAGALRALETNCHVFFKATKVDGVYNTDPMVDKHATRYEQLTYQQVVENEAIQVMDRSAITICADNNLPIIVFNLTKQGNLFKVASGETVGTKICRT